MSTKPKAREPQTVAAAIARHKAAQAAYDTASDQEDETLIPLSDAETDARNELAEILCTNDGEFVEKLRYLAAQEARIFGPPDGRHEFGSVVIAVRRILGSASKTKKQAVQGKVRIMDGERVVFTEEANPQQYVKLVVSGDVDEALLDALQDYVKRQKKRLGISHSKTTADKDEAAN
jgi:hypothetical protein